MEKVIGLYVCRTNLKNFYFSHTQNILVLEEKKTFMIIHIISYEKKMNYKERGM